MPIKACIFDAYGTLFDVAAAARQAASEPGREEFANKWPKLAEVWRNKQLQYTWLRAVMNQHEDFWIVTQNGLDYAMKYVGLNDAELRERLLQLYWELSAYPEVTDMLISLRAQGRATAILSNGSPEMLEGAVKSAGLTELLDDVLSVQSVGVFKPHVSVYELMTKRFECEPDEIMFFSSNAWDAAAAKEFGCKVLWVNRAKEPAEELPWTYDAMVYDLTPAAEMALKFDALN